ncbi:hypothetical protein FGO68_gene7308 [Halteria grandinella]|uniref:Uncharacterized protein n=1 Tax=Halteria grandinella TaxID=5974 RepID=A0A8J8NT30_HALGN|nr:hypothetical protein FGO68_gene7308 [Halteria grandinella]
MQSGLPISERYQNSLSIRSFNSLYRPYYDYNYDFQFYQSRSNIYVQISLKPEWNQSKIFLSLAINRPQKPLLQHGFCFSRYSMIQD